MEPPSARPWLGLGAAVSALPAAGGCFCIALVLAVVADSDPGVVYEQHRWLGAIVAASATCGYVAMMGWATLRHGGLPLPVLLMAPVLAGAPFLLPWGAFLPAAVVAVAACALLVHAGLAHPPASSDRTRFAVTAFAGAAFVLAVSQAIVVGLAGTTALPRAKVLADTPHRPTTSPPDKPGGKDAARAPEDPPAAGDDSRTASPAAAKTPHPAPRLELEPAKPSPTLAASATPAPTVITAARTFVRDYYAALDAHDFTTAWNMLTPAVRSRFGTFASWRKGYRSTISQSAGDLKVTALAEGAAVGLTLRAGDRGACGETVERRFAVMWRLARTDAGWRATAASARKLSGPEPC